MKPSQKKIKCVNGVKELFQRLMLSNKLPPNLAAENYYLPMLMWDTKGQEVREGTAGVGWLCSIPEDWKGKGVFDAGAGRLFRSHVW